MLDESKHHARIANNEKFGGISRSTDLPLPGLPNAITFTSAQLQVLRHLSVRSLSTSMHLFHMSSGIAPTCLIGS